MTSSLLEETTRRRPHLAIGYPDSEETSLLPVQTTTPSSSGRLSQLQLSLWRLLVLTHWQGLDESQTRSQHRAWSPQLEDLCLLPTTPNAHFISIMGCKRPTVNSSHLKQQWCVLSLDNESLSLFSLLIGAFCPDAAYIILEQNCASYANVPPEKSPRKYSDLQQFFNR